MSNLFWLTDVQMARLQPFFPKSHGKPRVDDRRVLSGIIFFNRNGLRWRDGWPCLVPVSRFGTWMVRAPAKVRPKSAGSPGRRM